MRIPVRSLAKLNCLLAAVFSGFVGIFTFTYTGIHGETIFAVIQSAITILVVGFLHVWVRVTLSKYRNALSIKKQQLYQFTISYVFTLLYSVCINPVRKFMADENWKTITVKQEYITLVVGSIGINILILIMHNFIIAYQAKSFIEVDNARLRIANVEANNQLLKQQIHPHFLFNALSIIKSLYRTDPNAGDHYIVHLADFLRAAISSNASKVVSLCDEMKLCNDYISMQKIRFGDALHCTITIPAAECHNGYVPSFSLQPLLENAIKHNDATDEQPLTIQVYTENGYVVVKNNLQRKKRSVSSTGSGLTNLIKRYRLLSKEGPVIQEDKEVFSVRLKILNA